MTTLPPLRQSATFEKIRYFALRLDWVLLLSVAAITAFGIWMVDVATRDDITGDPNFYSFRQLIFVCVGAGLMAVAMAVDVRRFSERPWTVWGALVGAVTVVLVIGVAAKGARRWIDLGIFQFQPSEIGKVALIIVLAGIITDRRQEVGTWRFTGLALGVTAVPAFVIFLQPDLGSSLVFVAIMCGMLYFAGVPWQHFAAGIGGLVALGVTVLAVLPAMGIQVLKDFQVDRLRSFIDSSNDPGRTGYQATQSRIAIGNGGTTGTGVDGATQVGNAVLPEHHTDFIFASVAEIYGFVGSVLLILVFGLLLWRALRIVTKATDPHDQLVAGGILAMLSFQVFVNIGMNVTLLPITGIPLPFMSYGGSHTLTNLIAVGILLRIHRRRSTGHA